MKYRTLGKTGLRVGEIGLGGYMFAPIYADHACQKLDFLSPDVVDQIFDKSLELGVNYVDTAYKYGHGESERMIGQALAKRPEFSCIVATKIGCYPESEKHRDSDFLLQSIDKAREHLQVDTIEIMQIHEADIYQWWWEDVKTAKGPVMTALEKARARGWVRFIGITSTKATPIIPLVETGLFDVVLTAETYDLLWRHANRGLLQACEKQNVGVVVGTPFHQGVLSVRRDEWLENPPPDLEPECRRKQLSRLYHLLDEIDISLTELGLRWLLSDSRIHCIVPGPRNSEQAVINALVSDMEPLPMRILDELDEIGAMEDPDHGERKYSR